MCGIIGQIKWDRNFSPVHPLVKLKHRGPDGSGEWKSADGKVYLGHTRLAIIEPTSAGKQPMTDASGRYVITFNGEIYNHIQLRRLLDNINWRGSSDTETLVELFAGKNIQALPLLKGMFAFAVYDHLNHSVLLVRDRLGIKPLWFRQTKDDFSFSSELKILNTSNSECVNPKALSEYLAFGRMPGNGEIIGGIESLAPGGWIKVYSDGKIQRGTWWPVNAFAVKSPGSKKGCSERVSNLVSKAVEEHLIADVNIGAFLSGGIDSSIITLLAGKTLGSRLRTFTVGFPQGNFDERKIAGMVARKAGTEHSEIEVNEETCLKWVKEAVDKLDLPSVDAINTYIVSKAVSNSGLKVALSGLGGDELFGGYPSFKDVPKLSWLRKLPFFMRNKLIDLMPENVKEKLDGLRKFDISDLTIARRRFISVRKLESLGFGNGIPQIPSAPQGLDTGGEISWAELQGYTIPMLLRDSDQMSMAVSLEVRVPFLDHVLVEEVLSIKQKFKKGKAVKSLLVEAFSDMLPVEVYNRPRQGFSLPMNSWIKGPLRDFTEEGLLLASDILHVKEPLILKNSFEKGNLHWTRLWIWCVLGYWLKSGNVNSSQRLNYSYTGQFENAS